MNLSIEITLVMLEIAHVSEWPLNERIILKNDILPPRYVEKLNCDEIDFYLHFYLSLFIFGLVFSKFFSDVFNNVYVSCTHISQ